MTVLVHVGPRGELQAMLDDPARVVAGCVFAALGLAALLLYVFSAGGSPAVAKAAAVLRYCLGYVIYVRKKYGGLR